MRKNVCLIGIMLWALSCFWACSDEDNGIVSEGSVQIYGRSYHLTSGVIWQNNPNTIVSSVPYVWEDKYVDDGGDEVTDRVEGFKAGDDRMETGNFLLSLYEEGLTFNETLEAASGKAACVCFHLVSSDVNRLVPGKYVFDEDKKINTFSGYCSSEYSTQTSVKPAAFSAGEVTVEEVGDDYRVVFRCETTFGGEISGEYVGKLDFCRVSQVSYSEYSGVSLAGLMEEVTISQSYLIMGMEIPLGTVTTIDEDCGSAFFSLSSGIASVASSASRNAESIDLALLWDEEEETFVFESPIRMRSKLNHQSEYNFPCHTIYMKAPADFTDEDFENLTSDSFSFEITEEKVEVPTANFKPVYVFFQTGRGVQGVMKVYGYTPLGVRETIEMGVIKSVFPANPALLLEIKCPAVVANPQIR